MFSNQKKRLRRYVKAKLMARAPFYRQYPAPNAERIVDSRALISFEQEIVYFRIPKAANSTIVASVFGGQRTDFDWDTIDALKEGSKRLSQLSETEARQVLASFRIFTFVRNPFSRIYSCYLDKVARKSMVSQPVWKALGKNETDEVTFDEFLDFLEDGKNIYTDPHWARQADLTPIPMDRFDLVGHVETFEKDYVALLTLLGIADRPPSNFTPHKTNSNERLCELTESQQERISRIYKADFIKFGYASRLDADALAPKPGKNTVQDL